MDHLNEAGLYIPVDNRPQILSRLLCFYAQQNFSGKIYIGDISTDLHCSDDYQNLVLQFGDLLQISYHNLRGFRLHEALLELLKIGTTDYAVFVEDDNFIFPAALSSCVLYLKKHPDYRIATGWGLVFFEGEKERKKSLYPMGGNELENPLERFEFYFRKGLFLPYLAVHRRLEFVDDLEPVPRCPDVNFIELIINALSMIRGKGKRLNEFYIARPVPRPGDYGIPTVTEWVVRPEWQIGLKVFQDALEQALVEEGASEELARKYVQRAFVEYMSVRFGKGRGRTSFLTRIKNAYYVPWKMHCCSALKEFRRVETVLF